MTGHFKVTYGHTRKRTRKPVIFGSGSCNQPMNSYLKITYKYPPYSWGGGGVANLSLVLVRETDDRQLSIILFHVYISQNL